MGYFRCWSVRNVLDLSADGRLNEAASRRVDAHLKGCAPCRAAASEFTGLKALLKKTRRVGVPPGLGDAVLAELEKGGAVRHARQHWSRLLRLSPPQAAALAYATLLLGTYMKPRVPSQGPDAPAQWLEAPR